MAYKRREEEAEGWKRNDMERRRIRAKVESGGVGDEIETERHWWDFALDGPSMSPVVEEGNPLDSETNFDDDDPLGKRAERTAELITNSATITRDNAEQADT